MNTQPRFTLARYGASKFEVIDNRPAKGWARQHEVLSDMTLSEAEAYVAALNFYETSQEVA